jgi:hypothetical protein
VECGEAREIVMALQARRASSRKVRATSTLIAVLALVAQPLYGLVSSQVANAASVVHTTDLSTWYLGESRTKGHNALVANGLHVWTDDSSSEAKAAGYYATPELNLSTVNSGSIDFISSTGGLPSVQLSVDRDGNGSFDGNLVYEPWAYGEGNWWVNKPDFGVPAGGGYASMGTLAQYQSANPNAKIQAIGYSLGSGVKGDAIISKITVGGTEYTFNAVPPAMPTGLKFANPAVSCGGSTKVLLTTATWNAVPDAVSYNYRSWAPNASSYNTEATAYHSSSSTNSLPGAFTLGEGPYFFEVQAVNTQGITSAWSAPCGVTYDVTAPDAPTLNSPLNNSTVNGATLINKWNPVTGAVKYIYQSYNNAGATSIRYTETTNSTQKSASNVPNGTTFWWRVKAIDAAGNESGWSNLWKVTIDNTLPTANIAFPDGVGPTAKLFTVTFSEAVNPADVENPANYFLNNWKPDAGWSFADLTGYVDIDYNAISKVATVHLTDPGWYISGEQQWGIRNVHDLAGNVLDPNPTAAYSTPLTAPTTPGAPSTLTPTNNTAVAWSWDVATDPGDYSSGDAPNGSITYHYILTKDGNIIVGEQTTTSTSVVTNVSDDGTYKLHVWAVDLAGNTSSETTGDVTIDTTGPNVTFDGYEGTDTTPLLTGTVDSDAVGVTVSINNATPLPVSSLGGGLWSLQIDTPLAPGTYTISVTATDELGNPTTTGDDTFSIVLPILPLILPTSQLPTPTTVVTPTNSVNRNSTNNTTDVEASVLGTATTKDEDKAVLGENSTKAAIAPSSQGWQIFGLAWYWWLLILAVLVGAIWWLIAAQRRRNADEV